MAKVPMEKLRSKLSLGMTLGADPEIFVVDENNNIIPAFQFLPGKKEPLPPYGNCTKLYNDGFAAEHNIVPKTCLGWLSDHMQLGLKYLTIKMKEHDKNAKLSTLTFADFSLDFLRAQKPEDIQLGCEPSLNAYGLVGNLEGEVTGRSTGGHMHFSLGGSTLKQEVIERCVKAMDKIIAIACVSMFEGYDNPMRRRYYGLPGEYRINTYPPIAYGYKPTNGFEYRVLSNAWLFHPAMTNLVWDIARKALVVGYLDYTEMWDATEEETIQTLIENDVTKAREILKRNEAMFKELIRAAYGLYSADGYTDPVEFKYRIDAIFSAFMRSARDWIMYPDDIDRNWHITKDDYITHCNNNNSNGAKTSHFLAMYPEGKLDPDALTQVSFNEAQYLKILAKKEAASKAKKTKKS